MTWSSRDSGRCRKRSALTVLALLAALLAVPMSASAATATAKVSFKRGVLTARSPVGQEQTQLWVSCQAGTVQMPGDPPAVDSLLCSKVRSIRIIGNDLRDNIQLTYVNAVDFPNVKHVFIDARGGDDYVLPSPLKEDDIRGGPGGGDTIQSGIAGSVTVTDSTFDGPGPIDPIFGFEEVRAYGDDGADDILDASAFSGEAEFHGNGGNDTLLGAKGDDQLHGDDGNDELISGKGDDFLGDTSTGTTETYAGGPGDDYAQIAAIGNVTLTDASLSGTGGDSISSIESASVTTSGAASSIDASGFSGYTRLMATPGSGNNTLSAGQGGSDMRANAGADTYIGGAGVDSFEYADMAVGVLTPTTFTDPLSTDALTSIEEAYIEGSNGDDSLIANTFNGDVTWSASGAGTDTVTTGSGDDSLWAYAGTFTTGGGFDALYTDISGNFTLTDTSAGLMTISGIDHFQGSAYYGGDFTVDGSGFSGTMEVFGGEGAQTFLGGAGAAILRGGAGDDVLQGGTGKDRLLGGSGGDDLDGGPNKDTCKGGPGADTFASCETKTP